MTYIFEAVGTGRSTGYSSFTNKMTYDFATSAAQIIFVVPGGNEKSSAALSTGAGIASIFANTNGSGLGLAFSNSFYGLSGGGNVCFSNPGNLLPGGPVALTSGGDCGAVHYVEQGRLSRDSFDGFITNLTVIEGDPLNLGAGVSTHTIANVPEPATWAMMLIGFGGIGYAMRRYRRTAVSFS